MRKTPHRKESASNKKQPVSHAQEVKKRKVKWCFELFDGEIDWHDDSHDEESFREVAGLLKKYSPRTWGQIEQDRRRDHEVPINNLIRKAQNRAAELQIEDFGKLWRFRFDNLKRLWGIRDQHVFRILWWDPQHRICPSIKKHT